MKTIEDFKQAVKEKNITFWNIHDCSMCGYKCGFYFNRGENPWYDNGCYCVNYMEGGERSWEDVANAYNIQTSAEYIKEMNQFWGFTE